MKFQTLATVVALTFIFTACSGGKKKETVIVDKNKSVELTPNDTQVKGYLSKVLEVVDGTYRFDFTKDSYVGEGKIQVKIKSIGKGNPKDHGLNDGNDGPLYLTVCDSNGVPLSDFTDISSDYKADGILKDMMTNSSENWIAFETKVYGGKVLPETAATFFITSKKIEDKGGSSSSSSDSETESSSSSSSASGSKEWDKLLDDYEAYATKLIKVTKKANEGDLSALLDYEELMKKAEKLSKSVEKAQKEKTLSNAQINRFMKLQLKLTTAAEEMLSSSGDDDDDDDLF